MLGVGDLVLASAENYELLGPSTIGRWLEHVAPIATLRGTSKRLLM